MTEIARLYSHQKGITEQVINWTESLLKTAETDVSIPLSDLPNVGKLIRRFRKKLLR